MNSQSGIRKKGRNKASIQEQIDELALQFVFDINTPKKDNILPIEDIFESSFLFPENTQAEINGPVTETKKPETDEWHLPVKQTDSESHKSQHLLDLKGIKLETADTEEITFISDEKTEDNQELSIAGQSVNTHLEKKIAVVDDQIVFIDEQRPEQIFMPFNEKKQRPFNQIFKKNPRVKSEKNSQRSVLQVFKENSTSFFNSLKSATKFVIWPVRLIIVFLKFISRSLRLFLNKSNEVELDQDEVSFGFYHSYLKPVIGFALVSLILIAPLLVFDYYNTLRSTQAQVMGVSTTGLDYIKSGANYVKEADFDQAEVAFSKASNSFDQAINYFNNLDTLAQSAAANYPPTVVAESLLRLSQLSADISADLVDLYKSFNENKLLNKSENTINQEQFQYFLSPGLTASLEKIKTKLIAVNDQLLIIGTNLDKVDINLLPSELRPKFLDLKSKFPVVSENVKLLPDFVSVLQELIGANGLRRYLVVFQNNEELRPTGGFMGSYALVDIKDGQIKKMEVPGGGFYDLKGALNVRVAAPGPFNIFSPLWQPWNANWFFDFPTSAQKISWFYQHSSGPSVDGVIAVNARVMTQLLTQLGEINMPEYNKVITAANFIEETQRAVELEYDKIENRPKKFISDLVPKVFEKLAAVEEVKAPAVINVLSEALLSRDIQLYFFDTETEKKVVRLGWSGKAVFPKDSDYLAVVHTNITGGKTDQMMKDDLDYQAEIQTDGSVIARVKLTRTHFGTPDDIFTGVENMDYVRFYVPDDAVFISAQDFVGPGPGRFQPSEEGIQPDADLNLHTREIFSDPESGTVVGEEIYYNPETGSEERKTVFGNWMRIKPGETQSVEVVYRLAQRILIPQEKNLYMAVQNFFGRKQEQLAKYSFYLQKQAGSAPAEIKVSVIWPEEFHLKKTISLRDQTTFIDQEDSNYTFNSTIDRDKYFGLLFEKK